MEQAERPAPPPPAPPPSPRRLTRARDGRLLGGVCAGIARHLGMDVTLVRILFVVAAVVLPGLGLLAYGLLWLLVPAEDGAGAGPGRSGPAEDAVGRGPAFWLGVGMVALGTLWLVSAGGPFGWLRTGLLDAGWLVPLVLIGLGVALWVSGERSGHTGAPEGAPGPAGAGDREAGEAAASSPFGSGGVSGGASTPAPSTASAADGAGDAGQGPAPTGPTHASAGPPDATVASPPAGRPPAPPEGPSSGGGYVPPVERRPSSPLGRVTLGLALLVAGALWLLRQAGLVVVTPVQILALALLVVGVGLLVGAWWGRGRLLILVGALLAPVVLVGAVGGPHLPPLPVGATVGEASIGPASDVELASRYEHGAGQLELDLRTLELDADAETEVVMGAGEVRVLLPEDLAVTVDARASMGQLRVLGQQREGLGPRLHVVDVVDEDAPMLTLRVRLGAGELLIQRDDADSGPDAWGAPDGRGWSKGSVGQRWSSWGWWGHESRRSGHDTAGTEVVR